MKNNANVDFNECVKTHNDAKVKTTSGVYNMLYGDIIGREITKAQSIIIRNGTVLEKLVSSFIKNVECDFFEISTILDYNKEMDMFNSCRINEDTFDISDRIYLIDRKVFKDIKHKNKGIEPDLLALIVKDGVATFYVIELKMGDNFDTKKSAGEKEHLTIFVEQLKVAKGIKKVYKISPFFSDLSKTKLSKEGFKGVFSEDEILNRNELSELFGIDFNVLIEIYKTVEDTNKKDFIYNICEESYIREIILSNPNIRNDIKLLNNLEKKYLNLLHLLYGMEKFD